MPVWKDTFGSWGYRTREPFLWQKVPELNRLPGSQVAALLAAEPVKAYVCRVFRGAQPHEEVQRKREQMAGIDDEIHWDLSDRELEAMRPAMRGVPVMHNHIAGRVTYGVVLDARLERDDQGVSMFVLIHLFSTGTGPVLREFVERNLIREVSLHHARDEWTGAIWIIEVSMCKEGRREAADVIGAVTGMSDAQVPFQPFLFNPKGDDIPEGSPVVRVTQGLLEKGGRPGNFFSLAASSSSLCKKRVVYVSYCPVKLVRSFMASGSPAAVVPPVVADSNPPAAPAGATPAAPAPAVAAAAAAVPVAAEVGVSDGNAKRPAPVDHNSVAGSEPAAKRARVEAPVDASSVPENMPPWFSDLDALMASIPAEDKVGQQRVFSLANQLMEEHTRNQKTIQEALQKQKEADNAAFKSSQMQGVSAMDLLMDTMQRDGSGEEAVRYLQKYQQDLQAASGPEQLSQLKDRVFGTVIAAYSAGAGRRARLTSVPVPSMPVIGSAAVLDAPAVAAAPGPGGQAMEVLREGLRSQIRNFAASAPPAAPAAPAYQSPLRLPEAHSSRSSRPELLSLMRRSGFKP